MSEFNRLNRRNLLLQSAGAAAAAGLLQTSTSQAAAPQTPRFRFCMNTSTIRGQELSFPQKIDVIGRAGYDGIEPWIGEIRESVEKGERTPADIRRQLSDHNLTVESAIGFARWIVDDDSERAKGFEEMKRDMELIREIGGTRIAAPPVGATDQTDLDLQKAAERYHALLELGGQTGVTPQLELWGFSKSLSRLGELMYVAVESGHPDACLLPDVYHIYKGGSPFTGLELVSGKPIYVMHMNDYPDIARTKIGDADRVYPGDGVAPIKEVLSTLVANGFSGALSLELFNRDYWQQDANEVARKGLAKMKESVNRLSSD